MRLALYARVSTRDKDQNPETQLLPLREYAQNREGIVVHEYVDQASATDLNHRVAWHRLMDDARLHKIDGILVWRMDRAFRSVYHAAQTLEQLKYWGVGLKSYQEAWLDTTSPMGDTSPMPNWKEISSESASRPAWTGRNGKAKL